MRHLESVINHLQDADSANLTYLVVGFVVSWVLVAVVVTLRSVYGCKLAKEHKQDLETGSKRFPHPYGGMNIGQTGMMQGGLPPDRLHEASVSYQPRRASMLDPEKQEVTIKIEGATKDHG